MTSYTDSLTDLALDGNLATLELTPDWLQGRSGYGGWQAALAVLSMRAVLGDELPLRSLQANFISPVPSGKVTACAELLRRGKSVAQLESRILVDGKVAFTALGIFGAARQTAINLLPKAPPVGATPDSVSDWPYVEGVTPSFMRHFHLRWGGGSPPYSGDANADASIFVRFRDDQIRSEGHLVCLADAIPPSALSLLTSPAMLSTINWAFELIDPPAAEECAAWFRFDTSLTAASDGYAWENTAIWSAHGHLIGLSRQCVAVFG